MPSIFAFLISTTTKFFVISDTVAFMISFSFGRPSFAYLHSSILSLNIKTFTPYTNKGAKIEWGIYQTGVSDWKRKHGDKPYPNMVVYFDEVNLGSTKEKVTKKLGN